MTTQTVLLLILAAVIALLVAIFQYFLKSKSNFKKNIFLTFLRFLSIFGILTLLINPQITTVKTSIQKPDLILLSDQSKSINYLKLDNQLLQARSQILNNEVLKDHFEIVSYGFGSQVVDSISNQFKDPQTQIYSTLKDVQKIHRKPNSPIVLISDGNQTYGTDYSFYKSNYNQPIYSVALGDTTRIEDFSISSINVNKYAYLDNKFPVEVLVSYSGNTPKSSQLKVYRGKQLLYKKKVNFNTTKKSQFVQFNLKAAQVGLNNYTVSILPFTGEKNTINNSQNFVVETIDQKTNVLLVSTITHPDIATLKRTIESTKRSGLTIKKPSESIDLEKYQLLILYQPTRAFKTIYQLAEKKGIQLLTITGKQTDWTFLNSLQQKYKKTASKKVQEIIPLLSNSFSVFNTDQFNFENYPPLETNFGAETLMPPYEILAYKKIANVDTEEALIAFFETEDKNEVVFFGEGFWKWRLANYKRDGDFKKFDDFFRKIVQYLSNKKQRKRLTVNYESTYYVTSGIKITSSFFNKNYEFDTKGKLLLSITDLNSKSVKKTPMVLKGNYYEADLSDLPPSNYSFSIKETITKLVVNGRFNIIDFDIEKQSFGPDIQKLSSLSIKNGGDVFYPQQIEQLIKKLAESNQFKPLQKSKKEKVPLISWKFMLALLLFLFGVEWFFRKYNGLV